MAKKIKKKSQHKVSKVDLSQNQTASSKTSSYWSISNLNILGLGLLTLVSIIVIIVFSNFVSNRKPEVVRHYACENYCPGPTSQYWIDVYEGVENPYQCEELGGKPYTYYGLESHTVCQVTQGQAANEQ